MPNKYSWKDRYEHARETYMPLWNAALNFIGETYGEEAVDKYLDQYFSKVTPGYFRATKDDVEREGAKGLLKHLVPHMEKFGWKFRVEKAEPGEIVINILKCGSKSLLIEKNQNSKYYCRHCGVGVHRDANLRALGIINRAEKTGEDSCIKTFKLAE